MSSNMKNRNPIVARPSSRRPVTLRDVHDSASDARQRSALRRLAHFSDAPLESMPADIDWFEARFPSDGFDEAETFWSSFRAYRNWRNTVRRAIRRHLGGLGSSVMRTRHVQSGLVSRTTTVPDPAITAKLLMHTDADFGKAYHANFRKAASGPKSD